jgi:DNA-binding CsgD family transcriptional regulator
MQPFPEPASDRFGLTPREHEVLRLLAEGCSTEDIMTRLFVSRNTVRTHVQKVIGKLGAHSKLEAVALARREGLV